MAQKKQVNKYLGLHYSNLWTVPCHNHLANQNCHNDILDNIASTLLPLMFCDTVALDHERVISRLTNKAREHHDRRCPSVSQLLKIGALIAIARHTPGDVDQAAQVAIHLHATGSMLGWSWWWAKVLVNPCNNRPKILPERKETDGFRKEVDRCLAGKPSYHLNKAKIAAQKQQKRWHHDLEAGEEIINAMSESEKRKVIPALQRARASIAVDFPGSMGSDLRHAKNVAEEAVQLAEEKSYGRKTACLDLAELDFKFTDAPKNRSRERFDALLVDHDYPWYHRMKSLFFGALSALDGGTQGLSSEEKQLVFKHLTEAQYISGMMGLVPITWPSGNRTIFGNRGPDIFPSDYLTREGLEALGIDRKQKAEELRIKWLIPTKRDQLFHAIYGIALSHPANA